MTRRLSSVSASRSMPPSRSTRTRTVSRVTSTSQSSAPAEAMRRDVPVVGPELNEVECATLMKEHETRHLLVGDDGVASGLISMRDVMQMMLSDKQYLIEQMQAYIKGY